MDDLNFNVDDIINDVNAKIKSAEKNEADEESVEAEPIADTENSSEVCVFVVFFVVFRSL